MSEKDIADLRWALGENEVGLRADMIALSFVRSAKDIDDVHAVMDEVGVRLPVIAKVEKPQAVDNLDEIVDAFDGIMVARGDLGVEMPLEQVPLVQKRLVTMCRRNAKPVIVATQMLDSMISASRPTRAEASDVANAIFDGADAVMLSAETSVGDYPVETVQTMAKIICAVENEVLAKGLPQAISKPRTKGGAVARAAAELGDYLSRHLPRRLHQERRHRPQARPLPLADPGPRLHPGADRALPAGPDLGRRDLHRRGWSTAPTPWCSRSTTPCSSSAAASPAT